MSGLVLATVVSLVPAFAGRAADITSVVAAADMRPYVQKIPGTSTTFEMVPVPGGRFWMGSRETEPGRAADEGPRHEVSVEAFWISTREVTWDEYDRFWLDEHVAQASTRAEIAAAGVDGLTRPTPPYADESFGFGKGKQPAIGMTHHAAMEYTRWLSRQTEASYRLPTEAEWEYACRAGTTTAYSFGDDPAALREYAWYAANSGEGPNEVGHRKPSAWGLFDMHGNVAEWVLDQYDAGAYAARAQSGVAVSPLAEPTEQRFPNVVRGGSWDHDPAQLRCAARLASSPRWIRRDPQRPQSIWWLTDATFVGFRVVRGRLDPLPLSRLRSRVTKESP